MRIPASVPTTSPPPASAQLPDFVTFFRAATICPPSSPAQCLAAMKIKLKRRRRWIEAIIVRYLVHEAVAAVNIE